ncbi:hypothetical protein DFH08DRAFT_236399 [Mycena albidolilacea]|uniref:Uncharacterized protein n=1 Tax=Mycena albidolilacea TaxID=1033008 RepID=A0AAD6ZX52_9AGAR|nr:hypothetical protein DFH08DRAFT_236399 [Mycena albidolilacea]
MALLSGRPTWLARTLIFCHIPFLLTHAHRTKHNDIGRSDDPLSDSGLTSASWIWTSGATTGNIAFIKTYISGAGRTATSATISLTVVQQFTLWVNGRLIGVSGDGADDWKSAQVFTTGLNATFNIFSVLAVNDADSGAPPPGLLAAIQVQYSDGSDDVIVSDSIWVVSTVIPSDFPTPSTYSLFSPATILARFGSGSWGDSVTLAPPDPRPSSPPLTPAVTPVNAPSTLSIPSSSYTSESTQSSSSTAPPTGSTSHVAATGNSATRSRSSALSSSASTVHPSSTFPSSISFGIGSTENPGSSSSPARGPSTNLGTNGAATPSPHTIPIGLIIGTVVGGLALIAALALLYWRHRRGLLRSSPSIRPFLFGTSDLQQISGVSLPRGDSPTASISHLRPAVVQAGHPQPYPQPRSGGHQSQGIIPPTKLEAVSASVEIDAGAPSNVVATSNAQVASRNEPSQTNLFDGAPDPDPETVPPPSYHT